MEMWVEGGSGDVGCRHGKVIITFVMQPFYTNLSPQERHSGKMSIIVALHVLHHTHTHK